MQWRCLLQALIWQESRFQIGAQSGVGTFGLTQIMPGTAGDLGIYPAYYDDPYLQVTSGARYLTQMLGMFDGNIIHALANASFSLSAHGSGVYGDYCMVSVQASAQRLHDIIEHIAYGGYIYSSGRVTR